jgi:hypothetical protein
VNEKLRGAAASCRVPLKRLVGLAFKSHPVIHFPETVQFRGQEERGVLFQLNLFYLNRIDQKIYLSVVSTLDMRQANVSATVSISVP